jgi:hypothetical protein
MQNDGELDRTIDSALAAYSEVEPLTGLEERVLYRVRLAEAGRRRVFGWALVIAVAASVVIAAVVLWAPRHSEPKTYVVGIPAVTWLPAPVAETPRIAPKRRAKSHALRKKPLPKEEQFPAPTPITTEERALLAFVGQHPDDAQQLLPQLQKRSEEPIDIQPIQILPLHSDGGQ